jgi:hypothetical protein
MADRVAIECFERAAAAYRDAEPALMEPSRRNAELSMLEAIFWLLAASSDHLDDATDEVFREVIVRDPGLRRYAPRVDLPEPRDPGKRSA